MIETPTLRKDRERIPWPASARPGLLRSPGEPAPVQIVSSLVFRLRASLEGAGAGGVNVSKLLRSRSVSSCLLVARVLVVLLALLGLRPTPLLGDGLEVVPPPDRGVVDAVRGLPQTVPLVVRNTGEAALEVHSLFYRSADGSTTAPAIKVLGLDGLSLAPGQSTTVALALPAYSTVGEFGGGLYLKLKTGPDDDRPFYPFTVKVREPAGRVPSSNAAGWAAGLLAALVVLLTFRVRTSPDGKDPKLNFFQSPDGVYSVSRFQVWLWTIVILFSYGYLFLSRGVSPDFPESIWALLGISVASIGTATAIAVKSPPASVPEHWQKPKQSPLVSMLSEDGKPSIMRLQLFVWTIATVVFFVSYLKTNGELWNVPSNLLILMGISHGGYLVDKAAESSRERPALAAGGND